MKILLDLIKESRKEAQKEFNRNTLAIVCLTMPLTTEGLMRKAHETYTMNHSRGLSHLMVQDLMEEYSPKDEIRKVESQQK